MSNSKRKRAEQARFIFSERSLISKFSGYLSKERKIVFTRMARIMRY